LLNYQISRSLLLWIQVLFLLNDFLFLQRFISYNCTKFYCVVGHRACGYVYVVHIIMNLVIYDNASCRLSYQLLLLLLRRQASLSGLLTRIYGLVKLKLILVVDTSCHRVAQIIVFLPRLLFETRFLTNFLRIVKMTAMTHGHHRLLLPIIRLTPL
jgi:hypothetical protein